MCINSYGNTARLRCCKEASKQVRYAFCLLLAWLTPWPWRLRQCVLRIFGEPLHGPTSHKTVPVIVNRENLKSSVCLIAVRFSAGLNALQRWTAFSCPYKLGDHIFRKTIRDIV
jgi:hypothetical protein